MTQVGSLPAFWSTFHLQRGCSATTTGCGRQPRAARGEWEIGDLRSATATPIPARSIDRRRAAATRHLMTRGCFYPLLFPRRPAAARWQIDPPDSVPMPDPRRSTGRRSMRGRSRFRAAFVQRRLARILAARADAVGAAAPRGPAARRLYARVVEPAEAGRGETLILGSGLCLEFELLPRGARSRRRLAAMGWRVIEPISPYHGLRAMPGFYGGEPFFALAPTGSLDLIAGQAVETALLTAWARGRFGGTVVGGRHLACHRSWRSRSRAIAISGRSQARPDAVHADQPFRPASRR